MNMYAEAIMLWLVMDSIGNIPIFAGILSHIPHERRKKIIIRESFFALMILFIFFFFGSYILHGMQLSPASLTISGAIILFLIAIKMIFPSEKNKKQKVIHEPFIVPLAMPLTVGPACITMVMLLRSKYPDHLLASAFTIFIAWFFTALCLYLGTFLTKFLGPRVFTAVERLMGMLLTTLAVQMLLNGISQYLAS
jgi:multiple antibiotic resistance protein